MTRLVNAPSDFPAEAVRGFVVANERYVQQVLDLGSSVNLVAVDTSVPPGDRDGQVSVSVAVEEPPASDWPYASGKRGAPSAQRVEVPLQPPPLVGEPWRDDHARVDAGAWIRKRGMMREESGQ